MHSRGVPEGQANGSAKILGSSTGGRNPLLLPIDGPASAESEDGMRQGFRIRQLTSRTRELNGQLGLLSRWQLTIGIVHVHVQLLSPCVTKSMRVAFLYRLCEWCLCVCLYLHTRGGTAETPSHAMDATKLKMQANLMPRDQHRHTWPIRQIQTRCAREKKKVQGCNPTT